ncbi:MAG: matrixin family metalloprotease [Actinobacteria bacterium]|nr:matrixin family metalloprotease [Actinomycetota bacterium]
MRPLALISCIAALVLATPATAHAAPKKTTIDTGFVVFKDMRTYSVTEVRHAKTGRVVSSDASFGDHSDPGTECGDSRHKLAGAYWHAFEKYFVNASSAPSHVDADAALADIKTSHRAWESPFITNCVGAPETSNYRALYGGTTRKNASLVQSLALDGVNAVAFQSLAGTICDGAVACVVVEYKGSKINESDLAFERDLTRYGYEDFWTTDDTTWFDSEGGRFAVVDVATHEFGHFAGLDHVEKSPALTMFPFVHDGDQSLGLGDMKGLLARY